MPMLDWWRKRRARREAGREKEARLRRGVDEVVNFVDPRLRGVPGYRSRLAPALERAVAVADAMVASVPEPVMVSRAAWAADPGLRASFASVDEMQAFFNSSRELRAFLTSSDATGVTEIYAAVGMQMDRSTRFAMGLQGEVLQRERQQVAVSFSDHRLGVIAGDESAFRLRLRRRILEEIAARAMQRIMAMKMRREALDEEKSVLQWKLRIYEMRRDGIGTLWHDRELYERHIRELRAQLGAARKGLDELVAHAGNITHFLQATVDEFDRAGETVRVEPLSLHLDAMNFEVEPGPGSRELTLTQVRVGRRRPRIVRLVRFSPDFVSVDAGFALRKAARMLGVR